MTADVPRPPDAISTLVDALKKEGYALEESIGEGGTDRRRRLRVDVGGPAAAPPTAEAIGADRSGGPPSAAGSDRGGRGARGVEPAGVWQRDPGSGASRQ